MPRIIIVTGDGKGKTTAAMGMALRGLGHGMRIYIMQFLKGNRDTGEYRFFAAHDSVDLFLCGCGFVPPADSPTFATHAAAAAEGLSRVNTALSEGSHDIYILDEICGAVSLGLLSEEEVVEVLSVAYANSIVVLTGRGAGEKLFAIADTVSIVNPLKHGYDSGITAQKGVEF